MTSHRAFATALTTSPKWRIREFFIGTGPGKGQQQGLTSVLFLLQHSIGTLVGIQLNKKLSSQIAEYCFLHQRTYIFNLFTALWSSLQLRTLFFPFYSWCLGVICELTDAQGPPLHWLTALRLHLEPQGAGRGTHFPVLPHCQSSCLTTRGTVNLPAEATEVSQSFTHI